MSARMLLIRTLSAASLLALFAFGCGARQEVWTPPPDDAIEAAQHAVFRAVNQSEREADYDDDEFAELLADAFAALDRGAFAVSADLFDIAARTRPHRYSYRAGYAEAIWLGRGAPEAALDQVNLCLEMNARAADCQRLRARVRADIGDVDGAVADVDAISALGDASTLREAVARTLAGAHPDTAVELLAPVARRPSAPLSALLLYARSLEASEDIDAARVAFERVRDRHRDAIMGATYLLRFLERHGSDRDARTVRREIEREIERRQPDRNLRPL